MTSGSIGKMKTYRQVLVNQPTHSNDPLSIVNLPARNGAWVAHTLIQTLVRVFNTDHGAQLHFSAARMTPGGKLVEPYVSLTREHTVALRDSLDRALAETSSEPGYEVVVRYRVDPSEYSDTDDSDAGAARLVATGVLYSDVDLPEPMSITCGSHTIESPTRIQHQAEATER